MKVVHINREKIKRETQAAEAKDALHGQLEQLYRRRINKKYNQRDKESDNK